MPLSWAPTLKFSLRIAQPNFANVMGPEFWDVVPGCSIMKTLGVADSKLYHEAEHHTVTSTYNMNPLA